MKRVSKLHRMTRGELIAMLLACQQLPGQVGTIAAPQFWRAFLLMAWDTGERSATLLRMQSDWIDWQAGAVRIPAECQKPVDAKTRVIRLQAETLAALRMIFDSRRPLVFDVSRPVLYQQLRQMRGDGN